MDAVSLDPRLLLLAIPAGVCLVITAIRWRHHLRAGERADAATPISGVVLANGDEPVMQLVLDLDIPRTRAVGLSVEEKHRQLHLRPFMVKTDGGELIDVDPEREVELHASLGAAQKVEDHRRYTKSAQVDVGERVYLLGPLHGERPHRRIAATLVSTEMIGETARRAAANDRKWLVRWTVMTVLGPLPYVVPFVPLFLLAFWIREMIVKPMWWDRKPYSEWYGTGRAQRSEYE
jgi:hypothetical protein